MKRNGFRWVVIDSSFSRTDMHTLEYAFLEVCASVCVRDCVCVYIRVRWVCVRRCVCACVRGVCVRVCACRNGCAGLAIARCAQCSGTGDGQEFAGVCALSRDSEPSFCKGRDRPRPWECKGLAFRADDCLFGTTLSGKGTGCQFAHTRNLPTYPPISPFLHPALSRPGGGHRGWIIPGQGQKHESYYEHNKHLTFFCVGKITREGDVQRSADRCPSYFAGSSADQSAE